jgi:signal transduction histidine kinase
MRLAVFITSNLDPILDDWVAFARNQLPAARDMDEAALLDHGRTILEEIVTNMGRPEGDQESKAKSEGNSQVASTSASVPSRSHARQRERQGFEVGQMVAEYRALRATVLRLWQASSDDVQAQDFDDMTRFNEAVDQALAESLDVFIAEVDRARDLFLGMLGHDLRGPLSTIASCATVELRKWPGDVRHAPLILRSVAQMKALLDDLMEFTSYRLGRGLSLAPEHLLLDQFARNTLDEIEAISSGRVLILGSQGDMAGEWDARRLHQALSNLVFNALKYGFPSSPVCVGLDGTRKDEVQLTVRNTGKPIAPGLLPQLFDPLVREKREDGDSGSQVAGANLGLGLYVVREIATAHGGSVEVISNDETTEFRLRLPRVCSTSAA